LLDRWHLSNFDGVSAFFEMTVIELTPCD